VDNLTHSLTGILLSRAGLGRRTPNAVWILLLAANAPDIDVLASFAGSLNFLHYHRYITHSLAAWPVLALACVLAVRLAGRKPLRWIGAYSIALIGVASHLALDLTNIYGVRLLSPFSGRWFRWDITGVIDFWIWGALLIATFAPMLARLVNAEIGAGPSTGATRAFALAALVFLVLYDGARWALHERAIATLDSRIYAGAPPRRVAAFPSAANPVAWRGLAETADTFVIEPVNLFGEFDPGQGRTLYKPEPSSTLDTARRTEVFQEFLRFSQFPFWQLTPAEQPENATRVEAMDLRFGDPQSPGFVATAIVDTRGQVLRAWFQFGGSRPR
jgi:inner membrane protein